MLSEWVHQEIGRLLNAWHHDGGVEGLHEGHNPKMLLCDECNAAYGRVEAALEHSIPPSVPDTDLICRCEHSHRSALCPIHGEQLIADVNRKKPDVVLDRVMTFGDDVAATREKGGWVSLWLRPDDARALADALDEGDVAPDGVARSLKDAATWTEEPPGAE
jgi:hypothetical protein